MGQYTPPEVKVIGKLLEITRIFLVLSLSGCSASVLLLLVSGRR